jgi:hypothetical protein
MKRVSITLLTLSMLVLVGCDSKPTHESLMKDAIAVMKEWATVLEGVKDEASAEVAKPKLQAINAKMKDLKTKADTLGKPPAEEEKRLKEKYEPEFKQVLDKLMPEVLRIGFDPKLGPILKDAMPSDNSTPSFMPGM